jgi:glycosyltransferase involved in cell wall biosynthesis
LVALVEQFWHREPGGTATTTEHTLAALARTGRYAITGLAAHHPPPATDGDGPWRRMPAGSTLRFHRLQRPLLYEAWLRLAWPSIDRHCRPGAVVWTPSALIPPTSFPVVATVNDVDFLDHPDRVSRRLRGFFARMWRRVQRRADLVVCPTELAAADCRRWGIPDHRLAVVPWGVAPPLCGPDRAAEVLDSLGLTPGYVLWVGPFSRRKNAQMAGRALGRTDVPVVAVAPPGEQAVEFASWGSLGRRLRRFHSVDDLTLSALYRGAGVLLYPSLAEGFGLPALEAMAHGTPVVTSQGTAVEEVAAGAALLIDPGDPQAIADAVDLALGDSARREALIIDGHTRAGQLTWENSAKGYAEAFARVR